MDTLSFLRSILPTRGVYVLTVIKPHPTEPRSLTANMACASLEALAAKILAADRTTPYNIYHACASFADGSLPPNKGLRKAANAGWVRSQWVDIDVGPNDPEKYASQKEALAALKAFCIEYRLNAPLIVSSGRGLHAYWLFDRDVPASQARISSRAFKRATELSGFRVDPSRTADLSSILRPPGTHWRKDGELEVNVLFTGKQINYDAFCSRFANLAEPEPSSSDGDDEWGTGPREYPPSSAHEIIKHCAALQQSKGVGGGGEPLWRDMLGLLKHTVEGEAIAHEWSSTDPRYSHEETQAKLDGWTAGPPTCATIRGHGGACDGCQYAERKSPINLGFVEVEPQAPTEPPPPPVDIARDYLRYADKLPHELGAIWNKRYQHLNGALVKLEPDPDGGPPIAMPFCLRYAYPYAYIRREDGTYEIGMSVYTESRQTWDRIAIPTEYLGDVRRLRTHLASYKVYLTGKNGPDDMRAFIQDLLQPIEAQGIESYQIGHFGWTDDGFVLGDTLITKKGERPVVLSGNVPSNLKKGFEVKGTASDAAASLMRLYGKPGAEMLQFAVLTAFASPLVKLMDADLFHGIPLGFTGESGQGKTTIAMVAASIYGRPRSMLLTASDMGTTTNALIQQNATVSNLPLIFDELHGMKDSDLPTLLYALSNGTPKVALRQDRTFNETGARWDNLTFVTSNANISAQLANQERNKAEATQLRLWECVIPSGYMERLFDTTTSKGMIEDHLNNCYGALGRAWIQFLVDKKEQVTTSIMRARARYVPNTQEMTRERFFYDYLTLIMVARHYVEQFGLIFPERPLEQWALNDIRRMRDVRTSNLTSYNEQLHAVLQAVVGRKVESRALPRKHTKEREFVDETKVRDPIAREFTEEDVLAITWHGFQNICRDLKINPDNLVTELDRAGILKDPQWLGVDKRNRMSLFRGTTLPISATQTRVVAIDLKASRAQDALDPEDLIPVDMTLVDNTRQSVH